MPRTIVYGHNLTIETEKVEISGEQNLTRFDDPNTTSGTPLARYFCKTCGNPIKSITPIYEGKTVLKLGIFTEVPHAEWESFASKRQSWEKPFDGCTQYVTRTFGEKME